MEETNSNVPFIIKFVVNGETRLVTTPNVPTTIADLEQAAAELRIVDVRQYRPPYAHFRYVDSDGDEIAITSAASLRHVVQAAAANTSRRLKLHIKWRGVPNVDEARSTTPAEEAAMHMNVIMAINGEHNEASGHEGDDEASDAVGALAIEMERMGDTRHNGKEEQATSCEPTTTEPTTTEPTITESTTSDPTTTEPTTTDPIRELFRTLTKLNFPLAEDLQELSMDDWCAIGTAYAEEIDEEIEDFLPTLREQSQLAVRWLNDLSRRGEARALDSIEHTTSNIERLCGLVKEQVKEMCVRTEQDSAQSQSVSATASPTAGANGEGESRWTRAVVSGEDATPSEELTLSPSPTLPAFVQGGYNDSDSDSDSESDDEEVDDDDDDDDDNSDNEDEEAHKDNEGDVSAASDRDVNNLPTAGDLSASSFDADGQRVLVALGELGFDVNRKGDYYLALASHYRYKLEDVIAALVD